MILQVEGLPPYKDLKFSIRNPRHKIHERFLRLREAATREMNGRKWSECAIFMKVTVFGQRIEVERDLCAYGGGIMDTLDGSHGYHFTFLPIVYQDDSQIVELRLTFIESAETRYTVEIGFLDHGEGN